MLSQEFIEEMKAKLLAEKDRLAADLAEAPAHTELGTDYDENAQEVELDEVNADVRVRVSSDLEKIDKALSKLKRELLVQMMKARKFLKRDCA